MDAGVLAQFFFPMFREVVTERPELETLYLTIEAVGRYVLELLGDDALPVDLTLARGLLVAQADLTRDIGAADARSTRAAAGRFVRWVESARCQPSLRLTRWAADLCEVLETKDELDAAVLEHLIRVTHTHLGRRGVEYLCEGLTGGLPKLPEEIELAFRRYGREAA